MDKQYCRSVQPPQEIGSVGDLLQPRQERYYWKSSAVTARDRVLELPTQPGQESMSVGYLL